MNTDTKLLKNSQPTRNRRELSQPDQGHLWKALVTWDLTVKNWLLPTSTSVFAISAQRCMDSAIEQENKIKGRQIRKQNKNPTRR